MYHLERLWREGKSGEPVLLRLLGIAWISSVGLLNLIAVLDLNSDGWHTVRTVAVVVAIVLGPPLLFWVWRDKTADRDGHG